MATIKDVSQLANVSISTVSRVINNTAQVAPEKREAVLAAMKELSFRPNSFAQALVSKRSNCIGVLVGDLCGGPFFAQMMRGIESMVDKANKFTIVVSGNHDATRERHAIQALLQRQCDALILHSKALPDEELSELASGTTPIVFINRQVPGCEDRCVWLDNQAGITTACQHLLDAGHRKIAFVTSDDEEFVDGQQRMAGYRFALQRAGIELDPALIGRAYADEKGGYVAMSELLARGVEFSAVLGFNDAMVAGAISCLLERGYKVITLSHLPGHSLDISGEYPNLYWPFGQHILSGAKLIANHPNLYAVYLTNPGCGPDTMLAHLFRQGLVVSCRIREKVERYMIERTAFATTQIVLAFRTLADLYRCFVVNHYDMNSIFAKGAHFQLPTKEKCQNLTN